MPSLSKPIMIGDREYRFAALNFRLLDKYKDDIDLMMSPDGPNFTNPAARAAIMRLVKASTERAGNPVDDETLLDNLDSFNFNLFVNAVFDRNGFLADPNKKGEGEGEAGAAALPS